MPSFLKGLVLGNKETAVGNAALPPEFIDDAKIVMAACRSCGREFLADRLAKHQDICTDTKKNGRKVFNAAKQRAINSDIPMEAVRTAARMKRAKTSGPPKTSWKEKSNDVRQGARAGRDYSKEQKPAGKEKSAPERKNSGKGKRSDSKSKSKGRR